MIQSARRKAQYLCSACGKSYDSLDKLIHHRKSCNSFKTTATHAPSFESAREEEIQARRERTRITAGFVR